MVKIKIITNLPKNLFNGKEMLRKDLDKLISVLEYTGMEHKIYYVERNVDKVISI